MKKKLLCSAAILIFLAQPCTFVSAKNNYYNPKVKIAIKKYRAGNYTGCIQDCQNIVKLEPKNTIAYYYLAMSYTQAGKKDAAIKYYTKVLSFNSNPKLKEYATTGKRCLETPDQCVLAPVTKPTEQLSDLDKFIASPEEDGLSPAVRKDFQQKHLDSIRNEINNNQELDDYHLQRLNDASDSNTDKIRLAQKPTESEINAALKVLKDAGINSNTTNTLYDQNNMSQMMNQNPDLMELNAMMGGANQSNNNSMLNMIPYMLTQNKNGSSNYSPQLMQSVIMNSMMSDFNYNVDVDKDK